MRIGIDLGGTKIEAIALNANGAMLCRHRIATPAGDYSAIVQAIARLVSGIESEFGRGGSVGVATPGSLSLHTGLIRNANSTVLNGKTLDQDLSRVLNRPVRLENDANCFALSEAIDGAAKGVETVFGVILGTGVGGGLVVHGHVLEGRNRVAGEWGHNPMPWPRVDEQPGPPCYCGKSGCIETFLSGPGLSRHFRITTGRELSAREVAEDGECGKPEAGAVLQIYEERLARALALVINIFDPEVIVLGGGMSNIERLYSTVPAVLARYVFSDTVDTPIVRAVHGDSSGVRGAAFLWPEESGT